MLSKKSSLVFNMNRYYLYYRLQYFARGVASYIKQLKTELQGKKPDAVKSDEVSMSIVSPCAANMSPYLISPCFVKE